MLRDKNGNYCHNCKILNPKDERPVIDIVNNALEIRLNGYMVMPMEEYYRLTNKPMPDEERERIKNMEKRLKGVELSIVK